MDEYIGDDSVVRVIDAFVETLDLFALGFKNVELNECGRPPYNPAMMLKLYIYGYMNKVRSSRRLQAEASRNIEVMWLTGKVVPDDRRSRTDYYNQFNREKKINSHVRQLSKLGITIPEEILRATVQPFLDFSLSSPARLFLQASTLLYPLDFVLYFLFTVMLM